MFKSGITLAYLSLIVSLAGCSANSNLFAPWTRVVITSNGAVGDGKTLNTQLIQKSIDQMYAAGGGTVAIPKGVFLSGAIFLKPGVRLELQKDAVLKGTTNISDYPISMTRIEGHFQPWLPALVNADHCDHLRISGPGTLDGSGQPFWAEFRSRVRANRATTNLDVKRPRLMFIRDCADVRITGLHFKDSAFWNLHLYRCNHVTIDGIDIHEPPGAPSTDGVDVDSCQYVTVSNSTIANSDDCIALKGSKGPLAMDDKDSPPDEHIHVVGCTITQGPVIVTCGSEATIVRDVLIEHCTIAAGQGTRNLSLLRLKLRPDTPQAYSDITVRDITLNGGGNLIAVAPWTQYFDLQGHKPPTSSVHDVTFSDIHGTCASFGSIRGNPGDTIERITFENIDVKVNNPRPQLSTVRDLVINNVKINGKEYTAPAAQTATTRRSN